MTATEDTTDRKAKRMRRIARILALIWAICWTLLVLSDYSLFYVLSALTFPHTSPPLEWWLQFWFLLSVAWVPVAISRRRERAGAAALVVVGLLVFPLAAWVYLHPWLGGVAMLWFASLLADDPLMPGFALGFALVFLAGLPLAAGSLFLASWRRSRRSESR